jgi:hypothetical protein
MTRLIRQTDVPGDGTSPPPRPHPGRATRFLVVFLVLIGGLLVAADRIGARYASQRLSEEFVAELDSRGVAHGRTDVSIGGFPFLTQVARGRYDSIMIEMADLRLDDSGTTVMVPRLTVTASGVEASASQVLNRVGPIVAARVEGTAVVAFGTLDTLVDYGRYGLSNVRFAESGGAVQLTGNANVAGQHVPISATAQVSAVDGSLAVKLVDARAVGLEAPGPVRNYLSDLVQRTLAGRLPQLPLGLTLQHVAVATDGLAISVVGQNVTLVS